MMSIAVDFPSIMKPRFINLGEERQMTKGDACKVTTAADNLYMMPRPSFAC
jgi:hypothetical protein